MYLEAAHTLLVHKRVFNLRTNRRGGSDIIHSTWAEGGRVLFSGARMLVGRHPERRQPKETGVLKTLRVRGMQIAVLPHALAYAMSRNGEPEMLYHDTHLDRSASLLKGKDGGHHLVLDAGYRTGPLVAPFSVEKSINLVRRECEKIQVQVHVPKCISIPYAMSAVQFDDGRTLITGGDEGMEELMAGIVGSQKLAATRTPIIHYPVFAGAGIHCLVTEYPKPLVRKPFAPGTEAG